MKFMKYPADIPEICTPEIDYKEITARRCRHAYNLLIADIREAGWNCGYAIGVHGTIRRDIDLIAVPWIKHAAPADVLAAAILEASGGFLMGIIYLTPEPF